jgi:transcriptional regulator with XRE-family HTH domain
MKSDKSQTIGNRIKEARKAINLSQDSLAKLVGVDQSTVALWETDKTSPREETLSQLAQILYLTPEFLRYGPPREAPSMPQCTVPVVGFVIAGNEIKPLGRRVMQETAAPPVFDKDTPEPTAALIVRGDSMWPVYRDGDILFFSDHAKPNDMIGTECVVKLDDGTMLVKRVMSGSRRGLYTLASYNAPEIHDVSIEWAAPVVWVRRNLIRSND